MQLKRRATLTLLLTFVLSMLLLFPSQPAAASFINVPKLFNESEWIVDWGTGQKTASQLALEVHKRLNDRRELIGVAALNTVHPNAIYDRTDPVFLANGDGDNYLMEFTIHWHRDFAIVQRMHVTRIDWQIINNQHLLAKCVYDDSTFKPVGASELNSLFSNLLPVPNG